MTPKGRGRTPSSPQRRGTPGRGPRDARIVGWPAGLTALGGRDPDTGGKEEGMGFEATDHRSPCHQATPRPRQAGHAPPHSLPVPATASRDTDVHARSRTSGIRRSITPTAPRRRPPEPRTATNGRNPHVDPQPRSRAHPRQLARRRVIPILGNIGPPEPLPGTIGKRGRRSATAVSEEADALRGRHRSLPASP